MVDCETETAFSSFVNGGPSEVSFLFLELCWSVFVRALHFCSLHIFENFVIFTTPFQFSHFTTTYMYAVLDLSSSDSVHLIVSMHLFVCLSFQEQNQASVTSLLHFTQKSNHLATLPLQGTMLCLFINVDYFCTFIKEPSVFQ